MGSYEREHLGKRDRTRFETHVDECTTCTQLVELAEETGSRIRIILLPILLAGGYTAWETTHTHDEATATTTHPSGGGSGSGSGWARRPLRRPARVIATAVVTGAVLVSVVGVAPTTMTPFEREASALELPVDATHPVPSAVRAVRNADRGRHEYRPPRLPSRLRLQLRLRSTVGSHARGRHRGRARGVVA